MVKLFRVCRTAVVCLLCLTYMALILCVFVAHYDFSGFLSYAESHWFAFDLMPNAVVAAAFFAVFAMFYLRSGKRRCVSLHSLLPLLITSSVMLLVLQLFIAKHIVFFFGNDGSVVRRAAEFFTENGFLPDLTYFQTCRNNIPLLFIYHLCDWVGGLIGVNGYGVAVVLGILECNAAVLLSTLCIYHMTAQIWAAVICYPVAVLTFGIFGWMVVPYTDILSIMFPILTIYIYLSVRNRNWHPFWKSLAVFSVPFLTAPVKATNLIAAFSILIAVGISKKKKITITSLRRRISAVFALLLLIAFMRTEMRMVEDYVQFEPDESIETTFRWFLLLGTNPETYGVWSPDMLEFYTSAPTRREKDEAVDQQLIERVNAADPESVLRFINNKILIFYNDGTFGWMSGGGFVESFPERDGAVTLFLRNLYFAPGDYGFTNQASSYGQYYVVNALGRQMIWITILCGIGLFIVRCLWQGGMTESRMVLALSFLGFFAFSMIFESSARLLLSYLPVFFLMSAVGIFGDAEAFDRSESGQETE